VVSKVAAEAAAADAVILPQCEEAAAAAEENVEKEEKAIYVAGLMSWWRGHAIHTCAGVGGL